VRPRPNILLIMSDQHRADIMGCAGDPVVRTPNMDRLASQGIRFENAYCQGPLCMPARASFLTERYVRDHGVFQNAWDVPSDLPTFVGDLRATGYLTSCIGKMHLWVHGGENGGRHHTRDTREGIEQMRAYGFEEVIETVGKLATVVITSEYSDYLEDRGLYPTYRQWVGARMYGAPGDGAGTRYPLSSVGSNPISGEDYIDAWHGRRVAEWIESYDRPQPFLLWVGFPGPHDPWDAPQDYVDLYRSAVMPMPASLARPELPAGQPFRRFLDYFLNVHSDSSNLTDSTIAEIRRYYYANVTVIDDAIGRIFTALEHRGLLDDTWVIYTSDHGEMMGEHRMLTKMVFYEPALKVPLIIRPPGGCDPRVVVPMIEHMDLSATIRAIAGSDGDPRFEGRSLLGWLDGGTGLSRDSVVSENYGFGMVRTASHKIVFWEDAAETVQFFDLVADPLEEVSLAEDPAERAIIEDLTETLVKPFLAPGVFRPGPGTFDRTRYVRSRQPARAE